MSPDSVRVFAALDLPAPVLEALGAILARAQAAAPRGAVRWVRAEGIHLTLQFYGDVRPDVIPKLHTILAEAAGAAPPLALQLAGLGAFPTTARPRVLWVGLAGDLAALKQLQRSVTDASQRLGFQPEARAFQPHLTLGRVNQPLRPADQRRLQALTAETPLPAGAPFRLETLSLIRSDLRPGGAVYTQLASSPLAGAAPDLARP